MAEITRTGTPSVANNLVPDTCRLGPFDVGEDIAAGDACYIKQSDGKVYRSIGTTLNAAAAKVDGYAAMPAKVAMREKVTLYENVDFGGYSGLTPGKDLFVSASVAGGLADAATTGGTGAVARTITATLIRVFRSRY
jgi:hypothetical protein